MLARMNGAMFARLWQKRVSAYAWAVLLALLVLPFSLRPISAATPPHIAVITMENHGYTTIVGNSNMPFTQGLIAGNGIASITDTCHPSLPNYLSITDGSIHGCPADTLPSDATYPGPTLYDELANAGISWKAYVEDATQNCDVNQGFAAFDTNHVPQAYYNSIRNNAAQCNKIQPLTQLGTDLSSGAAPSLIYIAPNLTHDMHDGTDQQGDAYLSSQVTQLRNSSWFVPGSRILIWWDEDEGTSNEQILLISVGSSHSVTIGPASHYGVLRGLEEAYGVGLLGHSADSSVSAEGGTVGDILPLLTGAAPPPPPPPSPSPTPTPTSTPTPTPSPSATPSPSPNPPQRLLAASVTRGIVRFTSTDFAAMQAAGFNAATDGGVQDNGDAEAAAGLTGMVWVDAYNNTTCTQTMTNAAIQALVQANVTAGHPGLRYMVGDEPTANGCVAAPAYTSMTQAVHAVDPTAKTWTFDDQFQVGNQVLPNIPMAGSVDILAFDIYPCQSGPCDYSAIDSAVQQIHAAGLKNWEFGIQDFSASPWRWPTPAEIQEQFAHWQNSGAMGYWVFAWDYLGGSVTTQSGNVAALQAINALPINGSSSPSPSPTPAPSPSPTPSVPVPTATDLYFLPWYDNASPGVNAETIHITNPNGTTAVGTISLSGAATLSFSVPSGQDSYYTFPHGTIGGPVLISSMSGRVVASLRSWYYQSFNETPARSAKDAATTLYLPWYDLSSPGMYADTIHVTNPGQTAATGTISLAGATPISINVGPGQDSYYEFPGGTIGGPVTIAASVPVLAALRAWYYQSFNETMARPESSAATSQYFPWYDLQSPGMLADTIHITNESGATATGSISLQGAASIPFSVLSGRDSFFVFPGGTIGGPVTITSNTPVLASLRAWYYQSFNETAAHPAAVAATTQYFPWYDLASPGMQADTIHITNESGTTATGTITPLGDAPITFTVLSGQDIYIELPAGTIGGPVTITSSQPVIGSLRAWYYQSFNEVPASP